MKLSTFFTQLTCQKKFIARSQSLWQCKEVHLRKTTMVASFCVVSCRTASKKSSQSTVKKKSLQSKVPLWLANIHVNLMRSVMLPSNENGNTSGRQGRADLSDITPSQLVALTSFIKPLDKGKNKIISSLCRNLDFLSLEEIIVAADILYINGVLSPTYIKAMTLYLYEMIDKLHLSPSQIVRIVFHIQLLQYSAPLLLIELEDKIQETLSNFTIDELACICHLLFYGQYRLRSMTLVDQIGDKLLDEFESLTPENLPMMMKAFRYSNYIKVSFYKRLGDHLVSTGYLKNYSSAGQLMHFAFAFASVHITHHTFFKYLLKSVQDFKHPSRLKDLSKIIWACGTLFTSEDEHLNGISAVVEIMRKNITKDQVLKYPDNLMDFLVGLAYLNIYPLDLIEIYLSQETIQKILGLDTSRAKFLQLQFLDTSLSIECPEFGRQLLSELDRERVQKFLTHWKPDIDMKLRKPIVPVLEALREVLGKEYVHCGFVLPHFKTADILLAFDEKEKHFVKPDRVTISSTPGSETRIVIMLLSKAQTSYDDQPLGMLQCKIRQLRKLGYLIVKISAEEALNYTLMEKAMIWEQVMSHVSEALGHSLSHWRR